MYYIGIDLGGTNIAAGVVDESCNIVAKGSIPTKCPRSAEEIMDDMAAVCMMVLEKANLTMKDVEWVGIGAPGTVDCEKGVIEYSNNIGFEDVHMSEYLGKKLGCPIYIANDANAAAYGEVVAGAARNCTNAIAITLGTGVGSGIIIDGKIYCGTNFAGAELGHTVIEYNGRPCTCGRRGCWEAYSSATALAVMTREKMEKEPDSALWKVAGSLDRVGGKTAFDAMRLGDKAGSEVVDEYISYLACGLANVINIFQPEVICISGGISREGDNLIVPLMKIIEKERYTKFSAKQTKIVIAELGNDAGIIGAAWLGRQC